jgi:hypothetical protein
MSFPLDGVKPKMLPSEIAGKNQFQKLQHLLYQRHASEKVLRKIEKVMPRQADRHNFRVPGKVSC